MLDTRAHSGSPFGGLAAAILSHAAIVAVVVAWRPIRAAEPVRRVTLLEPAEWPAPTRGLLPVLAGAPTGIDPLSLPPVVPPTIPPLGGGIQSAIPNGSSSTVGTQQSGSNAEGVWDSGIVDERPEVLSGPPLTYPEPLRRARMEGRVVLEVVVDTFGRAEPASLRIVESSHRGFESAARSYVQRALFRPARVMGRSVRVLVRVPVEFRIAR